jgi:hypothetical protein
MLPTIGRIVHYRLTDADATAINKRRADFEAFRRTLAGSPEVESGTPGATGHMAHVGNHATAGDYLPAMVVATFGGDAANLQVFLDGNDTYWATSRPNGDGNGTWTWPPRA